MVRTIKTNKKRSEVEIRINKDIYPSEAISSAAEAFKVVGTVKVNDTVTIRPKDSKTNLRELGYEFCDYVLGLIGNGSF